MIYNHAFDIAFSQDSNKEDWREVPVLEIKQALLNRIKQLDKDGEWLEATSSYDTYEKGE